LFTFGQPPRSPIVKRRAGSGNLLLFPASTSAFTEKADYVSSIEPDMNRLTDAGLVADDGQATPQ